jgi:hypothetical protein
MAYENIPAENAPALAPVWAFTVDMERATIDDLEIFDPEVKTGTGVMLEFLDRVVTNVKRDDESLGPKVRGHGIPYPELRKVFEQVGAAMREQNNAKN